MPPHVFLYGPDAADPDPSRLEAVLVAFSERLVLTDETVKDAVEAFGSSMASKG